jgi:hypothetical protein
MPSTGETRCVRSSGVGEGSAVCVTVGGIVGETTARVFVGSGIEVGSITGAGVGAQAVSRKKATTMRFFIEGNYMVFLLHVIMRSTHPNEMYYGVAPTKLGAYNASSYPGRTERAVRQSSMAPFVFP